MANVTEEKLETKVAELERKLATAREQMEDQLAALKRISGWANEAYPTESFPDQDLERANEVLAAAGISISAMHGQWARHLIGGIGRIAKEALAEIGQPQDDDGSSLIGSERKRQISQEGWTPDHDDWHTRGEIADAAECYAAYASDQVKPNVNPYGRVPHTWPWDREWWKPSNDPIRNLVKAGALIAAEIDRIKRSSLPKASDVKP